MVDHRTYGKNLTVKVEIYAECKYTASREIIENPTVARYEIESWDIVTGQEATEIGDYTDANSRDDFNEYLVLHLTDGNTATFRNSYVDMFRVA